MVSSQMNTKLEIDINFLETLACAMFKEINMDLFCKTLKPVEQVLRDGSVSAHW
jgi:endoplasmic reticulum chaperone BiP